MLIQPPKPIELQSPYRIQLTTKNIELRCAIEIAIDLNDEWDIPDPAYFLGQKVWIVNPDLPPEDWEEKRIFGIELYAPRWQHGSLMSAPVWYYGVKALMGRGEIRWVTADQMLTINN